ncbi:DUF3618 domain-containing protein [Pararhizobium mangrovi]|uniref:DUF3618 domain-containing protein n=1 Tax=Pararhizobium mangrovi TaxID=2590452 RepID=A0A506UH14_9HYPH|nr:DUF3618 domain-containing protein [Pararhizobium mangrovi]TPW31927.1 DUF3618 domain-containing protein [Pararhizobium mangrovi]
MSSDTERLEKEADSHRSNLDSTFDAIRERLSVGQIVDEFSGYLKKGQGAETMNNLGRQVRDNPLALGLVGAGIAWLFFGNSARAAGDEMTHRVERWRDDHRSEPPVAGRAGASTQPIPTGPASRKDAPAKGTRFASGTPTSGATGTSTYSPSSSSSSTGGGSSVSDAARSARDAGSRAASGASQSASRAGESIAGGAQSARDSASRGLHDAGERVSGGMHDASEWANESMHGASESIRRGSRRVYGAGSRAGRGLADLIHDEPLVFGAVALAVGAAAGALMPPTRSEDEWMGETRDRFRDEAYARGEDALHRAENVAEETYSAASDKAEEKGLKPKEGSDETIAEKVSEVARTAEKTAKEETKKQSES